MQEDKFNEVDIPLTNLKDWKKFIEQNRWAIDQDYISSMIDQIKEQGFHCSFLQEHAPGKKIKIIGANYRETVSYKSLNCRHRAVLEKLIEFQKVTKNSSPHIYCPEALSDYAKLLKSKFKNFIGSEYSEDMDKIHSFYPERCENILSLTFSDQLSNVVIVNDVFEHIPDIEKALGEIFRILLPGGCLISTFPFAVNSYESIIKAKLEKGKIVHLLEPEFHGDPVNPNGALVFQIPGWGIVETAKSCGFSDVTIDFVSSVKKGILAKDLAGIFVMKAIR